MIGKLTTGNWKGGRLLYLRTVSANSVVSILYGDPLTMISDFQASSLSW